MHKTKQSQARQEVHELKTGGKSWAGISSPSSGVLHRLCCAEALVQRPARTLCLALSPRRLSGAVLCVGSALRRDGPQCHHRPRPLAQLHGEPVEQHVLRVGDRGPPGPEAAPTLREAPADREGQVRLREPLVCPGAAGRRRGLH